MLSCLGPDKARLQILRNEVNEEHWLSQSAYQTATLEALRAQLLRQQPSLSEAALTELLSTRVLGFLPIEEWHGVLEQLHKPAHVTKLAPQLCQLAASLQQRGPFPGVPSSEYDTDAHAVPFADFLQVCCSPGFLSLVQEHAI